ncbi:hypothetical protein MHTCC0001_08760 [Flavobacteriaceae bacterium MHTCC 0001]
MKNIQCKLFGHNYEVTRHVTSFVKEYTCKQCGKQLTTNSTGALTELTPKFKEINDALEHYYFRKHQIRLKTNSPNKDLLLFSH